MNDDVTVILIFIDVLQGEIPREMTLDTPAGAQHVEGVIVMLLKRPAPRPRPHL